MKRRGDKNGVELHWLSEKGCGERSNVRTFDEALFSPNTATADPIEVGRCLRDELIELGVEISLIVLITEKMVMGSEREKILSVMDI